jgi:hypothetical protein
MGNTILSGWYISKDSPRNGGLNGTQRKLSELEHSTCNQLEHSTCNRWRICYMRMRPLAQRGEAHATVDPTRAGRCMTATAEVARFDPERAASLVLPPHPRFPQNGGPVRAILVCSRAREEIGRYYYFTAEDAAYICQRERLPVSVRRI